MEAIHKQENFVSDLRQVRVWMTVGKVPYSFYSMIKVERLVKVGEEDWDIQEIKRIKKKQLFQYNLGMVLLVILLTYFMKNGVSANVLLGICCAFFWIFVAGALYTFKTGKVIGTKSSQRVHAFDKDHMGEKQWKRKSVFSVVVLTILSVGFTVIWFVMDFDSAGLEFPIDTFAFIGCWIGYNIGEIVRLSKL